eukprot:COSAG02_NODE_38615_length_427_cov_0.759146_1_plen_24_part_01
MSYLQFSISYFSYSKGKCVAVFLF